MLLFLDINSIFIAQKVKLNNRFIMKIHFFLFYYLFLLCNTKTWSIDSLLTYAENNENSIRPVGEEYYILDPEGVLTSKEKNTLFSYMEEIDNKYNVKVIIILIEKYERIFEDVVDFGRTFTNEFILNDFKRYYYVTVSLSMNSKQYGTSTWKESMLVYPHEYMTNVLDAAEKKMANGQYYETCEKMLGYFKEQKDPGKQKDDSKTGIILGIVFGSIFGVIIIFAVVQTIRKALNKKIMEKMQIEIIDKIKSKEITVDYFNTHCILCFKEMYNDCGAPPVKDVEVIQVQHPQQGSEEIKATNYNINENQKEKEDIKQELITLPCGHKYHSDCFDKWYKRDTMCPKCRERLDGLPKENNMQLGYHVMNIQLTYLPFGKDYIYSEQTFKIIIVNKVMKGRNEDSFEDVVPDKKE